MFRTLWRRRGRPARSRPTARPRLESLEDRTVPSNTALTVSPNPAFLGQAVTLTATVTETAGDQVVPGTSSGTVTFFDGSTQLGSPVTVTSMGGAQGVAQLTTSGLGLGSHTLTAKYSGETFLNPIPPPLFLTTQGSTSNAVAEVVISNDVTALLSVTVGRGPTGNQELVTVRNVSGQTIPAPLSLVLTHLPRRARLRGATGTTTVFAPGSPFEQDNITLLPGGFVGFLLSFSNPGHKPIHFTAEVFAGSGTV